MSKKEVLALLVVFIVYVVIGGAVFMAVEGPNEDLLRNEIMEIRRNFHGTHAHWLQVLTCWVPMTSPQRRRVDLSPDMAGI
ncbi:hypothetical protein IscW_ISCW007510 [Ixodes scapularis]|uniref:Uncharacterized protein n=1 Tax=Ixodes scapularis TaxID=6945 RepID=B7PS30_IXOSC|nr:hypothetical protein IscW_ISCW007510 [Ixodes scapularis]|eukprot:XP_002401802.1 hypothetical protein IscW_ISCW007510 [Ixodes scapularis]